ncbi:MAG: ABC transporter permease [Hyphomicrobiales bacterium]
MNYKIKQVVRSLKKDITSSILKVVGWVIALTASLFVFLYINYHYSFDSHIGNQDKLYRAQSIFTKDGVSEETYYLRSQIGVNMEKDIPNIGQCCRVSFFREVVAENGNKAIKTKFNYVDQNFFDVFQVPLESTMPASEALRNPKTVVLNRKQAKLLFGDEDPIGKTVKIKDTKLNLTVTGIVDIPTATHLPLQLLISNITVDKDARKDFPYNWTGGPEYFTYFRIPDNVKAEEIVPLMDDWADRIFSSTYDEYGYKITSSLMSMKDIHLKSKIEKDHAAININYLYLFFVVALLILFIATVNYINLTMASLYNRTKQFGIIKVMGAKASEIRSLFFIEGMIILGGSFILTLILVEVLHPYFEKLTNTDFSLYSLITLKILVFQLLLVILIALITIYAPARMIGRLSPQNILRGVNERKNRKLFSQTLIGAQFVIASILISATITIHNQFAYLDNLDYGFERDNIQIYSFETDKLMDASDAITNEVRNLPEVKYASMSSTCPGVHYYGDNLYSRETKGHHQIGMVRVGSDYEKLYNIRLAAGRYLEREDFLNSDSLMLINESFARELGYDDPINKVLYYGKKSFRIIGVFKDIKHKPGADSNVPIVILQKFSSEWPSKYMLNVRLNDNVDHRLVKDKIENILHNNDDEAYFTVEPLNDIIFRAYKTESMIMNVITIFSVIAIFIACLGLFGLSDFIAKRQIKEISIRKILGADYISLFFVQLYRYLKIVVISNIIAIPIIYYILNSWLNTYPDRTPLHWYFFGSAFLLTIIISIFTVGTRIFNASKVNPIDSIKAE